MRTSVSLRAPILPLQTKLVLSLILVVRCHRVEHPVRRMRIQLSVQENANMRTSVLLRVPILPLQTKLALLSTSVLWMVQALAFVHSSTYQSTVSVASMLISALLQAPMHPLPMKLARSSNRCVQLVLAFVQKSTHPSTVRVVSIRTSVSLQMPILNLLQRLALQSPSIPSTVVLFFASPLNHSYHAYRRRLRP